MMIIKFTLIYTLYADSKDNENDINEKIEKYILDMMIGFIKKPKKLIKKPILGRSKI